MTALAHDETEPVTFDSLNLSPEVRRAIDDLGYKNPTPVQSAVFEPAKRGHDLVVQARTGTGKTAAFGLPMVDSLVRRKAKHVQAIILCPTRELALQVSRELIALAAHTGIQLASVYGGAAMSPQVEAIRAGAQIVVGTPGRVLDHITRGTIDTKQIKMFALDECDEMLSMGFLPQIDKIWSSIPPNHQVLLFSATIPRDILRITETRLKDPQFVTLSGDHVGALEIAHFVYLSRGSKVDELLQIIEVENPESAIVFCNTRDETVRVAQVLQSRGFAADWLNADLPQNDREVVMRKTRESLLRFLVCTDVAARGIDISHLTHVINYDFPDSAEQYVHRTGRTGRAGRMGSAISLVQPGEIGDLYFLRIKYKIRPIEKQLPSAVEMQTRAETDVVALLLSEYSETLPAEEYLSVARRIMTHDESERIISGLLQSALAKIEEAQDLGATLRRKRPPLPNPALVSPNNSRRRGSRRDFDNGEKGDDNTLTSEPSPNRTAERTLTSSAEGDRPERDRPERDRPERDRPERIRPERIRPERDGASERAQPSKLATGPDEGSKPRPSSEAMQASVNKSDSGPTTAASGSGERELGARRSPKSRTDSATDFAPEPTRVARPERSGGRDAPRDNQRSNQAARGVRNQPGSFEEHGISYSVSDADASSVGILDAPAAPTQSLRTTSSGPGSRAHSARPRTGSAEPHSPTDDANANGSRGTEVYVSVGRKEGAVAEDFEQLLVQAGIPTSAVLKVTVRFRNTFLTVAPSHAAAAIAALNGVTIAGRRAIAEESRSRSSEQD